MQLDRIVIEPRARSAWEAIDLGCLLARRWWFELFVAWAVPGALLLCLLFIALPPHWWWLNALIVWWLKPVWDCAPLYIASRKLFGEAVKPHIAWRKVPRLLGREALPWLTWRRFSVTRSTDMPVTLLEALRGTSRRHRLTVLHGNIGSGASWLTVICANIEMIIYFGVLAAVWGMLPDTVQINPLSLFSAHSAPLRLCAAVLTFSAAAAVAPFYTMAGFALYISRRIELEGWDIEIRFRHIAARRSPAAVALALALLVIGAGWHPDAHADTATTTPLQQEWEARQRIDRILHSPAFDTRINTWGWRLKKSHTQHDRKSSFTFPDWFIRAVEFLEGLGGKRSYFVDAAQMIRLALALLLAGLLAYLLYRYRNILRSRLYLPQKRAAHTAPEILFGLDVRAESLPDDVPAQVLELWQAQQPRAALSLLYRAALARLLARFALPFHGDHTEQECAVIVEREAPAAVAPFFRELTANWQRLAYAHRPPPTAVVERLCAQWHEVFADAD